MRITVNKKRVVFLTVFTSPWVTEFFSVVLKKVTQSGRLWTWFISFS